MESTHNGLETLLEFLNTVDVESGADELPDDETWREWLAEHGLGDPVLHDVVAARAVRDTLRAAAAGERSPGTALPDVPLTARLDDAGRPVLDSPDPLGRLVATAVTLAADGRWRRIKLCDAHTCRYAFFDTSRNRSRHWCSMAVCGNREKTRAFRERHRAED